MKSRRALILVHPHASLIHEGKKRAILKSRRYRIEGEPLYLVERHEGQGWCYGVVVLGKPERITRGEAVERFEEHRVTEEEMDRWWNPQVYPRLWLYPIKRFKPRLGLWLSYERGQQTFDVAPRIEWLED
jgi:hypothetical protein